MALRAVGRRAIAICYSDLGTSIYLAVSDQFLARLELSDKDCADHAAAVPATRRALISR